MIKRAERDQDGGMHEDLEIQIFLSRKDAKAQKDGSRGQPARTMDFIGNQSLRLRLASACYPRPSAKSAVLYVQHSFNAAGWKTCPTDNRVIKRVAGDQEGRFAANFRILNERLVIKRVERDQDDGLHIREIRGSSWTRPETISTRQVENLPHGQIE